MKGKRDPRFQQVYSPPFIFVRKSFQDANNDTSQPFSAHPLLVERTFWSAIYDIPPLFSAHPLLRRGLGRLLLSCAWAPSFLHLGSFFPVLGLLHPLFLSHFVFRLRLCGLHLVTTRIEFYGIRDVQTTLIINRNINGDILITVRIG